jgi:NifB/MoaA-like Fe-S oxidoreductase
MAESGMTELRRSAGPARHELPAIDDLAMIAARHADRLVAAARDREVTRWEAYLEPLPDRLRDEDLPGLRKAAIRARAAYGPKDSVRDVLPADLTEPFLEAIDRLLREINRSRV